VTYLSNSQVVKTYVPIDQTQHAMSSSSNSHSSAKKGVVPVVGPHFGGDQCDVIYDHKNYSAKHIFFSQFMFYFIPKLILVQHFDHLN
jgi:hypothetical protein